MCAARRPCGWRGRRGGEGGRRQGGGSGRG
uniref:Uncharacterized protein n=1 Tax=Arundo donax TaxID=35708 RepID=A0A0A9FMP8_ARUDO